MQHAAYIISFNVFVQHYYGAIQVLNLFSSYHVSLIVKDAMMRMMALIKSAIAEVQQRVVY